MELEYTRDMQIRNTGQLSKGTGCKYLLVMTSHIPGEFIAIKWLRKLPAKLNDQLVYLVFAN